MMGAAVSVESLKLRRSLVGVITTCALLVGTVVVLAGITFGVAQQRSDLVTKLGSAARLDWAGLVPAATQIISVGSLLGCGVMLAWMFGREFGDGTITGLFALPISRGRIALAKLAVYALWTGAVGLILALGVLCLGLAFGYGSPAEGVWAGLVRLWVLMVLTGFIAIPVAWTATVCGSVLAGVGCTVGLVVIAQVTALLGVGGWMPVAAPALWAMSDGSAVTVAQLGLVVVFALVFAVLTAVSWDRLQLRR